MKSFPIKSQNPYKTQFRFGGTGGRFYGTQYISVRIIERVNVPFPHACVLNRTRVQIKKDTRDIFKETKPLLFNDAKDEGEKYKP